MFLMAGLSESSSELGPRPNRVLFQSNPVTEVAAFPAVAGSSVCLIANQQSGSSKYVTPSEFALYDDDHITSIDTTTARLS